MRMSMYFTILLSVLVFYFPYFVNMCACHIDLVLNKLTYLLTYHFGPAFFWNASRIAFGSTLYFKHPCGKYEKRKEKEKGKGRRAR